MLCQRIHRYVIREVHMLHSLSTQSICTPPKRRSFQGVVTSEVFGVALELPPVEAVPSLKTVVTNYWYLNNTS